MITSIKGPMRVAELKAAARKSIEKKLKALEKEPKVTEIVANDGAIAQFNRHDIED